MKTDVMATSSRINSSSDEDINYGLCKQRSCKPPDTGECWCCIFKKTLCSRERRICQTFCGN